MRKPTSKGVRCQLTGEVCEHALLRIGKPHHLTFRITCLRECPYTIRWNKMKKWMRNAVLHEKKMGRLKVMVIGNGERRI